MQKESYKILGVAENATHEEIEASYKRLKEKYSRDRFLEGEAGNEAARKLTQVESAYADYLDSLNYKTCGDKEPSFEQIEDLIRDGKLNEAQIKLDAITNRSAEWHYIQSVIFYKKNWSNESKMQLSIALEMEPNNQKYADAYKKLTAKMASNEQAFRSGNGGYGADGNPETSRQMGGTNDCMSMCATWCCMDMLCNLFCCH